MASSTLAGERRWASARRGGMTVLGKVAVPKPLNLPSQRLENHGLDPNVEIVPKGSLSWGSRSSSSSSNPWGSSVQSPKADGTTNSPSSVSGHPSSGGSGTRPSTAGSDRIQEPTANAWGPNSRPSSASGLLMSNQASLMPSRPHSAETRPGSSQLSRFAGPLSDNLVAWGPTGTVDKLVVSPSKNDAFSLSTGDFPTLGSQRDNSEKNFESQDHGSHSCPSSSPGRVVQAKERTVTSQADVDNRNVNTWKRDANQHFEDGDPQQYLNANVLSQHVDAWHGPPINASGGVWYRGPAGGPPYPPVAPGPGGFPMEPPFPYYHPHFPGPPPGAGAGPRGQHPNNGDSYRPQMPDAYIHAGGPIRPGFYPGPAAYESYYGPPMGYLNSNEREVQFMEVASAPPVYNWHSVQNAHEPRNIHARAGSEQVESSHSDDTRGPYKVLMKQHNDRHTNEEEENWEHSYAQNLGNRGRYSSDNRRDGGRYPTRTTHDENSSYQNLGNRGRYFSETVTVNSPEGIDKAKVVDDSWEKKSEIAASSLLAGPEAQPVTPKDSTFLQKIGGLNARGEASEGPHHVSSSNREEQKNRVQVVNAKSNNSMNEVGKRTRNTGDLIPASWEEGVSTGDGILEKTAISGNAISRRVDYHGKARFNNQYTDGRQKKSLVVESSVAVSGANILPVEAFEESDINLPVKDEGEALTPPLDLIDGEAQRAKMRELAKQRAIQLQKEEEERIREQKAKALAKLEELNRRTKAGDGSIQKLEKSPPSASIELEQEEMRTVDEPVMVATTCEAPTSVFVPTSIVTAHTSDSCTIEVGEFTVISRDSLTETTKVVAHNAGAAEGKSAPQVHDTVSKHNHMSFKQKQNIQVQMSWTEKQIPTSTIEEPKIRTALAFSDTAPTEVAPGDVGSSCESSVPDKSQNMSSVRTRKNSRSSRNKHKIDDLTALPSLVPKEAGVKDAVQPSEQHLSLSTEEAHGRVNNQWKSHNPRKMPRNLQANRVTNKTHGGDAVVWAPVRSRNKAETEDEATEKALPDAVTSTLKSDTLVQNSLKSKRAEMERYVPKPVAKELAQIQQSTPSSLSQTISDETGWRAESDHQSIESSQPAGMQNKQTRAHGSSSTSNPSKNLQKSVDQRRSLKPDASLVNTEPNTESRVYDEWNPSEGWNSAEFLNAPAPVSTVVKDHGGVTGKGKRHPYKGHRNTGNNDLDQKNITSTETHSSNIHPPAPETSQTERPSNLKESRWVGERSSTHWQPKSQASYQRAENKEESSEIIPQLHSENKNVNRAPIVGHQEERRERKGPSSKGRPYSPNQGIIMDGHPEIQFSNGFQKNGSQNNRAGRGNDSRGEWSSAGQDNRQHNIPANGESRGQGSHYEYQSTGSYNTSKSNNFEGPPTDGARPSYNNSRGRGQGRARGGRGNFYDRQNGTVQVDAGYD